MHIKFKIGKFLEALDIVNMTVDKKGNLDTKDVLLSANEGELDNLYLYATDFINQSAVKLTITVIEPGDMPFNPNQLYMALSKRDAEAEATIISDDKQSIIKIGKSKFKLSTSGKQSLVPRLQSMPFLEGSNIEITGEDIIDIFKRVKTCTSNDVNNTNRYIMRGIRFRSVVPTGYLIESTDGFSACVVGINDEKASDIDIIIPGEFTTILLHLASKSKKSKSKIQIIQNNYIHFRVDNVVMSTSVMTGKFPSVEAIITAQTAKETFQVDQSSCKAAVERILGFEGFAFKTLGKIILQAKGQSLSIRAFSSEDCEELIDLETSEGQTIPNHKLNIDGRKFLDILSKNSLGKLTLGINTSDIAPLYIEEIIPDKISSKYLIMPTQR